MSTCKAQPKSKKINLTVNHIAAHLSHSSCESGVWNPRSPRLFSRPILNAWARLCSILDLKVAHAPATFLVPCLLQPRHRLSSEYLSFYFQYFWLFTEPNQFNFYFLLIYLASLFKVLPTMRSITLGFESLVAAV